MAIKNTGIVIKIVIGDNYRHGVNITDLINDVTKQTVRTVKINDAEEKDLETKVFIADVVDLYIEMK